MMKTLSWFLAAIFLLSSSSWAADRPLGVRVLVRKSAELSPSHSSQLEGKIRTLLKGLGASESNDAPFVALVSFSLSEKSTTPTAPPMVSMKGTIEVSIGENSEGIIHGTYAFENLVGVGATDQKALTQLIDRVKVNPKWTEFETVVRDHIVNHHESMCNQRIEEALNMASMGKHEGAIEVLAGVSPLATSCWSKAGEQMTIVYKAKLEFDCSKLVATAKATLAMGDWEKAFESLVQVAPDLTCYEEASQLLTEVQRFRCTETLAKSQGAFHGGDVAECMFLLNSVPETSACFEEAKALRDSLLISLSIEEKEAAEKEKALLDFEIERYRNEFMLQQTSLQLDHEVQLEKAKSNSSNMNHPIVADQLILLEMDWGWEMMKDPQSLSDMRLKSAFDLGSERKDEFWTEEELLLLYGY